VTQLFSKSFKSIHAIDVSPSMLSTFSTELPSDKYPNVTHSQHTLSSSSSEEFAKGSMKSPIEGDADRVVSLPRSKWDVAAVILVLHHVDDIEGFMTGLTGLVEDGGWVVFTEFTNLGQGHKVSIVHIPLDHTDVRKRRKDQSTLLITSITSSLSSPSPSFSGISALSTSTLRSEEQ
jgi:2-polyprenyl-3-methyl-5-hydroxy-6-metoxy-1,4-benzoquinol methylase